MRAKIKQLTNYIDRLKGGWVAVVALVTFILSIFGEQLEFAPMLWRDAGAAPTFAIIRITLATVVACIIVSQFDNSVRPSMKTTIMLLFLGCALWLAYFIAQALFTCPYVGESMVVGWSYLEAATKYVAENPNRSCSMLIEDHVGLTYQVWPSYQILLVWLFVTSLYILFTIVISVTVLRTMLTLAHKQN